MAYYVHLFETNNDFQSDYHGSGYTEPWTSYNLERHSLEYNKTGYEKLLETPLTFEIISGGTLYWRTNDTNLTRTIEYKKNDGEWTSITSATGSSAPSISVVSGDTVQFRGDNATYSSDYAVYSSFEGTTCGFNLKGSIMSLVDSDDFATATTLSSPFTFNYLFNSCTGLNNASNLKLPAMTLRNGCYRNMFQGCTNLTAAPELPATALTSNCYQWMFFGCSSLTTAPKLPATSLGNSCYQGMFYNCSALNTAPALMTDTLQNYCYQQMFNGCTNLNYIQCLATNISATNCTTNWVNGVQTNSGTFIKVDNFTGWTTGVDGIPENWNIRDVNVN
jgi:hypothetical protein